MATTQWVPLQRPKPKSWLLRNGDVVTELPLETTTTGRKIRIAGTDLTAYARDINTLLYQGAQRVAQSKRTSVWMPVVDRDAQIPVQNRQPRIGFDHYVGTSLTMPQLWWEFAHPEYPIRAVVTVDLVRRYEYNTGHRQFLVTRCRFVSTFADNLVDPYYLDMNHTEWLNRARVQGDKPAIQEFLDRRGRRNQALVDEVLGKEHTGANERQVARALLDLIRTVESIAELDVPDFSKPSDYRWVHLQPNDTNVNAEFVDTLLAYLDGGPAVAKAMEHFRAFQTELRKLGVVLGEAREDSLAGAIACDGPVTVEVCGPHADGGGKDHEHALTVDIRTGTFVVTCTKALDPALAQRWEEAIVIAEITGKDDEMLAYARATARHTDMQTRVKNILQERT